MKRGIVVACSLLVFMGHFAGVRPQRAVEDTPRKLWDTGLIGQRPKSPSGAAPATRLTYVPAAGALPRSGARGHPAILGVTLWRLRAATLADDPETALEVREAATGKLTKWTPERLVAETPLGSGDRVRITIESPSSGFLYVVNREEFAAGRKGRPFLVFPTLRTHGGINSVTAGRLVEIPAQEDRPPYFTLRRSTPDQTGEALILLVTPKPLPGLNIGREPLELTDAQLGDWERRWGAKVERLELQGGSGRPWTRPEKAAGGDRSRLLTQEEPAPQTLYVVDVPPGAPLLVTLPLRLAR